MHALHPRLIRLLYRIAAALIPLAAAVHADAVLPAPGRNHAAARVARALRRILVLTLRIDPARIGPAAFTRPRPPRPAPLRSAPLRPAPLHQAAPAPARPRPRRPARPLSARQFAAALDAAFAELAAALQAARQALPSRLRILVARARTLAGCIAPTPHPLAVPPH